MIKDFGAKCRLNHIGSLGSIFFTEKEVTNYKEAKEADTKEYAKYFNYMLDKGIYLAPAQFEAMFISYAHSKQDLEKTLEILNDFMRK